MAGDLYARRARGVDGEVVDGTQRNDHVAGTLFQRIQALFYSQISMGVHPIGQPLLPFNRTLLIDESFEFIFNGTWLRHWLEPFHQRDQNHERLITVGISVTGEEEGNHPYLASNLRGGPNRPVITLSIHFGTASSMWLAANY